MGWVESVRGRGGGGSCHVPATDGTYDTTSVDIQYLSTRRRWRAVYPDGPSLDRDRAPGRRVGTVPLCFREPPGLNRSLPSGDKLSGFSTLDSGQGSQGRELCWPLGSTTSRPAVNSVPCHSHVVQRHRVLLHGHPQKKEQLVAQSDSLEPNNFQQESPIEIADLQNHH
ncbi:unnamed protein product [Boreogadus saida]